MAEKAKSKAPMSEQELPEYYQSRKGDVSMWAKEPRKLRRTRGAGPTTTFAIRLTPQELSELQRAAEAKGVNVSEFIRSTSLEGARLQPSGA